MTEIGYYNGKFVDRADASVSLNDRALYFGDGVYEVTYNRNHIPFALDEHLDRLFDSLEFMRIESPMTREEYTELFREAAKRIDSDKSITYLQISRGVYPRMHAFPPSDAKPGVMLFCVPFTLVDVNSPIKLTVRPDTRWGHCNIKSLNLIGNVMAAEQAAEKGAKETILHRDGVVTECASSNLFIVENGVLRTAPKSNLLLGGITRKHLIELALEQGIPVREEAFTLDEMMAADEVILTSTSTHGARVYEIDGVSVGMKAQEIAVPLQNAYAKKLERETAI